MSTIRKAVARLRDSHDHHHRKNGRGIDVQPALQAETEELHAIAKPPSDLQRLEGAQMIQATQPLKSAQKVTTNKKEKPMELARIHTAIEEAAGHETRRCASRCG